MNQPRDISFNMSRASANYTPNLSDSKGLSTNLRKKTKIFTQWYFYAYLEPQPEHRDQSPHRLEQGSLTTDTGGEIETL